MLDPDVRRLLETFFTAPADATAPDVALLRAGAERSAVLGGAPDPVHEVHDLHAVGTQGRRVRLRTYRPSPAAGLPLLLYAHGGGWVTGSLESHDNLCRKLANRIGALVAAVDYGCAPEQRYPAALDDFDAAWHWCREEARALGIDPTRMAVAGDSAGANLAAALTLRLRSRHEAQPALQLLIYPCIDARTGSASYDRYADGFNLSAAMMRWYWRAYAPQGDPDDPELSPASAASLEGLAPAVVLLAEADILHDEGADYARRLAAAGVPVDTLDCPGMIHGFIRWGGEVAAAARHLDEAASRSRARLLRPC